jgi:hypothetical protein
MKGLQEEKVCLGKREIYVCYGAGMGSSKLRIPAAEAGTARNINTIATWIHSFETYVDFISYVLSAAGRCHNAPRWHVLGDWAAAWAAFRLGGAWHQIARVGSTGLTLRRLAFSH